MDKQTSLKLQIDFLFISKRIKILAIAIIISIIFVFGFGLIVSYTNIRPQMYYLNISSIVVCLVLGALSYPLKKVLLKKVTLKNFFSTYFNAHIFPLLLCDLGGLFCVSTNLFINQNLYLAVGGILVSSIYIILIFPSTKDIKNLEA